MTNEQLRQNAAAMLAFAEGKPVQWAYSGQNEWIDVLNPAWDCERYIYRPKPVSVVRPWSAADVPPVCWLLAYETEYLVTAVSELGVWTPNGSGNQMWTWARLSNADVKHSTDKLQWHPCSVTEGAK